MRRLIIKDKHSSFALLFCTASSGFTDFVDFMESHRPGRAALGKDLHEQ